MLSHIQTFHSGWTGVGYKITGYLQFLPTKRQGFFWLKKGLFGLMGLHNPLGEIYEVMPPGWKLVCNGLQIVIYLPYIYIYIILITSIYLYYIYILEPETNLGK